MDILEINLKDNIEDLRYIFSNEIETLYNENGCWNYSSENYIYANITNNNVCKFIDFLCSQYANLYKDKGVYDNIIVNITKDNAQIIFDSLELSSNIFFKARLYDILWESKLLDKNNIVAAKKAIENYNKIIDYLFEKSNIHDVIEYLTRLLNLSLSIRENSTIFSKLKCLIAQPVKQYFSSNFFYFYWYNLLKLIAGFSLDDENKEFIYNKVKEILECLLKKDLLIPNAAIYNSENLKEYINKELNYLWIRQFYELILYFVNREKNRYLYIQLKCCIAKIYEIEAMLTNNSLTKSSHLKNALLIYRQCSKKEDVNRLLEVIEKIRIVQPYQEFSFSQDITDIVNPILENIKGKSFINSLTILLNCINIFPSKTEIYANEQKHCNDFFSIFAIYIHDENGKVIKTVSSKEEHLNYNAITHLYYLEGINFSIIINSINLINSEHFYTIEDIEKLVSYSPIISRNNIKIISKGIYAFLTKDYMTASHFLILQFEELLRFLLSDVEPLIVLKGKKVEENLIKVDYLLDKCLEHHIFDENMVWFFKSYLVDKQKNLRNLIAHGMFSDYLYSSEDIGIVCYAIIWLILKPIVN